MLEKNCNKFNEIGSKFWIENYSERVINRIERDNQIYKLLDSGRSCIRYVLENERIAKEKRVAILPRYTCESVIQPFIEKNFMIYFYEIDKLFCVSQEEIDKLVEKTNPSVILIQPCYGFDQFSDIRPLLAQYMSEGIIVIEDLTQSLTLGGQFLNSTYYICSLRKWFAIPDGGFVISKYKKLSNKFVSKGTNANYLNNRTMAMNLKKEYVKECNAYLRKQYMQLFAVAEEALDNQTELFWISDYALSVLKSIDVEELIRKRRNNYNYLLEGLSGNKDLFIPVKRESINEAPLYFVFYTENNEKLQKYLATENIYLPILWPKHAWVKDASNSVKYIFNHIVCVPCDHRYDKEIMQKIIKKIKEFFA